VKRETERGRKREMVFIFFSLRREQRHFVVDVFLSSSPRFFCELFLCIVFTTITLGKRGKGGIVVVVVTRRGRGRAERKRKKKKEEEEEEEAFPPPPFLSLSHAHSRSR